MKTIIRLRIKKELHSDIEKKILKLKGGLIAKSFTDIIHMDDHGEDYYVNYFSTEMEKMNIVNYVNSYIDDENLSEYVNIL